MKVYYHLIQARQCHQVKEVSRFAGCENLQPASNSSL